MDDATREALLNIWTLQRYVASLEVQGESFDELEQSVRDRRGELALAIDRAFFNLMLDQPRQALAVIRDVFQPAPAMRPS